MVAGTVRRNEDWQVAPDDRTYGVGPIRYLQLGILFLMTFIAAPALISQEAAGDESAAGPFLVVWLTALGYWWYLALFGMHYKVVLQSDGWVELKAVLRTRRVRADNIVAIRPAVGGLDPYTLTVQTSGPKLRMTRMPDLVDFCTRLLELNPSVDLRALNRKTRRPEN